MGGITWALKRHNRLLNVFLCGGAALSFCLSDYYTRTWSKGVIVEEGIDTCFSRLHQSYTAYLLGDQTSLALSPSFQGETEHCFSDVITYSEKNLGIQSEEIEGHIHSVNAETYRLHRRLQDPTLEGGEVAASFESIQKKIDGALALLSREKSFHKDASFYGIYLTYGLLFLALWQSFFAFFLPYREKKKIQRKPSSREGGMAFSDILAPCLERASGDIFKKGVRVNVVAKENLTIPHSFLRNRSVGDALFFALTSVLAQSPKAIKIKAFQGKGEFVLEVIPSGVQLSGEEYPGHLAHIQKILGPESKASFKNSPGRKSATIHFALGPGPSVQREKSVLNSASVGPRLGHGDTLASHSQL